MSIAWGADVAARRLLGDAGITVTVTVHEQTRPPEATSPPPSPPPAPAPGTRPPTHHHSPGELAFTGLPASQLLVVAIAVVALGIALMRLHRPSSEVNNA